MKTKKATDLEQLRAAVDKKATHSNESLKEIEGKKEELNNAIKEIELSRKVKICERKLTRASWSR